MSEHESGPAAWQLLSEAPAYVGYVHVTRRTYRLPDGQVADWDVVRGGRSVGVVARTLDGLFITARQFRPGPGRVLEELPGGEVEPGEDIGAAAARELLEETGFRAGSLEVVGSSWVGGRVELERFCVIADECVPDGDPRPGPLEFIEVGFKSPAEFVALVRSGDLTEAGIAYRALDRLGLVGFTA